MIAVHMHEARSFLVCARVSVYSKCALHRTIAPTETELEDDDLELLEENLGVDREESVCATTALFLLLSA